jgi:hypothetical protein
MEMQLYKVARHLGSKYLIILIFIVASCKYVEPIKDRRDQYRDIELIDTLKLRNGEVLYSYRYTHFRSRADEIYYSISNDICEIDSTNAVFMTPFDSFINGFTNDSINIVLTGQNFDERNKSTNVKFKFIKHQFGLKYSNERYLGIMKSELCK